MRVGVNTPFLYKWPSTVLVDLVLTQCTYSRGKCRTSYSGPLQQKFTAHTSTILILVWLGRPARVTMIVRRCSATALVRRRSGDDACALTALSRWRSGDDARGDDARRPLVQWRLGDDACALAPTRKHCRPSAAVAEHHRTSTIAQRSGRRPSGFAGAPAIERLRRSGVT